MNWMNTVKTTVEMTPVEMMAVIAAIREKSVEMSTTVPDFLVKAEFKRLRDIKCRLEARLKSVGLDDSH